MSSLKHSLYMYLFSPQGGRGIPNLAFLHYYINFTKINGHIWDIINNYCYCGTWINSSRARINCEDISVVLKYVCMQSRFRNVITLYVFNACTHSGHALAGCTALQPDNVQAVKLSKSGRLARLQEDARCRWEAEHDAEKGQRLTRMRDDARSRRDAEAVYIGHGVTEWPRWPW